MKGKVIMGLSILIISIFSAALFSYGLYIENYTLIWSPYIGIFSIVMVLMMGHPYRNEDFFIKKQRNNIRQITEKKKTNK